MTLLAASQPVINTEDNFIVHNGWTESELFIHPLDARDGKPPEPKLLDPKPIKMAWNRKDYSVPPGETRQVPFDALRLAFGDPRTINGTEQRFPGDDGRVGVIPRREAELLRLAIRWGLYDQGIHLLADFPAIKHATITTVSLGEDHPSVQVWTPAQDPEGKMQMYGHPEVEPNRADFLQIVESSERRIATLENRLERALSVIESQGGNVGTVVDDGEPDPLEKDVPHFP